MGVAVEALPEFSFEEMAERNLIGGAWCFSREGYSLDIYDPSNSTVIAAVPLSTRRESARAIEAATQGLAGWNQWPRARRFEAMRGVLAALQERAQEIAALVARDSGLPVDIARREMRETFARMLGALDAHRQPADAHPGVIAQVLSWSNPLRVCLESLAVDLANGNVAIVKPSLRAPLALVALGAAFQSAGVPGGVFNLLHGAGRDVGAALVRAGGLKRVDFQGSRASAAAVQRATNQTGARLQKFLREVQTVRVDDTADAGAAACAIVEACRCHGALPGVGGLVVHVARRRLAPFVAAAQAELARTEYGSDPIKTVAPFIEEKYRALCLEARARFRREGAVVLAEAPAPEARIARMGWFVSPVLLRDVTGQVVLDPETPLGPTVIVRVIDEVAPPEVNS